MKSRGLVLLMAIGVGVLLTAVLAGAAYYSYEGGAQNLSIILFWPNSLLQNFVPCINGGAPERPFCEGTPMNALAFVAGFPLSIAVYSALAYVLIRRRMVAQ